MLQALILLPFLIFLAIVIFLPAFDGLERGKWRWETRDIIPAVLIIVLFTVYTLKSTGE